MKTSIQEIITKYLSVVTADEFHRYKSWDNCFQAFSASKQAEIQIIFFPTLRCFNFFCQRTMLIRRDIASNLNRFVDRFVQTFDTTHLWTERRATDKSTYKKMAVQW